MTLSSHMYMLSKKGVIFSSVSSHSKQYHGGKEMAQWLRVLTAPTKYLGMILRIHIAALSLLYFRFRDEMLFWFSQTTDINMDHIHICGLNNGMYKIKTNTPFKHDKISFFGTYFSPSIKGSGGISH